MAYSILIKNGTIVDGSGKEPYKADIGISGDKIKDIGENLGNAATKIIDASGLYVTPGFVDITNHADVYGTLFYAPMQESMLMQGVTTILVGNCGESLAPLLNAESARDLERWTTGYSVPVNWKLIGEFYETLKKIGIGVNVGTLVGHETLKRCSKDADAVAALLDSTLKEGAWGLSSNFNFEEWTSELEAETSKLLDVVKKNNALYKIHLRDEGRYLLPSIASLLRLIRSSGTRTVISHFKAVGRQTWGDFRAALKMILNAQKDGLDVSFDFFPYLRTGSMLVSLLPAWAKKGTTSEIMARFDDAAMRSRILDELSKMTIHSEKIMFASAAEDKKIVGKSLKDIIEHTGLASEETILDILKINNLSVTIFGRTLHPKNLLRSARFSNSILATDGAGYNLNFARSGDLAHPRAFGAYPRFLNKIAPAAKLKIQDAVKKMAYAPAKAAGFATRGLIEKNFTADIAIFETSFKDASTYKNPYSYATGLSHLIISGRMSVEGDKITAKNGEALAKNER